jgi:hypothetical protein
MRNLETELQNEVLSKVRNALTEYLDAVCTALPVQIPKPLRVAVFHSACGEVIETVERLRKIIDEYCVDDELQALVEDETDWKEVVVEINARLPEVYVGRPKIEV